MKKRISLTALLAVLVLCLGLLCGCQEKEPEYAIKVGDLTVSVSEYERAARLMRNQYLNNLGEDESTSLWNSAIDDSGMTLSEGVVQATRNQLVWMRLYQLEFDRLGMTLTETETKAINTELETTVIAAGGLDKFNQLLAEQGYTYDEYKNELIAHLKQTKVLDYYFGQTGAKKPTSDQDIMDWYNVNNARIKVLTFLKEDPTTGDQKASSLLQEAKKKAQEAYDSATRPTDQDLFDEVISIYEDPTGYNTQSGELVVSKNGGYDDNLTQAALEMKLGEVRLLDLDLGYTLIKRYNGTDPAVFTADLRQQTLETIRAEAIEELLTQWETEHTVSVDQKVVARFRPEVLLQQELDARTSA